MEILTLRWILQLCAISISPVCSMSANFPDEATQPSSPLSLCSDDEYRLNNRCCKKCPAGTYVVTHCSKNHGLGHCRNCTTGKNFTAFPNGLGVCLPCRSCREDEDVREECTVTRNTVCGCKPETYLCTANMNCSDVGDCLRCPEGQCTENPCYSFRTGVGFQKPLIITSCIICICLIMVGLYFFIKKRIKYRGPNTSPKASVHRSTAPVIGCSDTVTSLQSTDLQQDSVHSTSPLIPDMEDSHSGSIKFTHEDLAQRNSMEWLTRFNNIEATSTASLPAVLFLPARIESDPPTFTTLSSRH